MNFHHFSLISFFSFWLASTRLNTLVFDSSRIRLLRFSRASNSTIIGTALTRWIIKIDDRSMSPNHWRPNLIYTHFFSLSQIRKWKNTLRFVTWNALFITNIFLVFFLFSFLDFFWGFLVVSMFKLLSNQNWRRSTTRISDIGQNCLSFFLFSHCQNYLKRFFGFLVVLGLWNRREKYRLDSECALSLDLLTSKMKSRKKYRFRWNYHIN